MTEYEGEEQASEERQSPGWQTTPPLPEPPYAEPPPAVPPPLPAPLPEPPQETQQPPAWSYTPPLPPAESTTQPTTRQIYESAAALPEPAAPGGETYMSGPARPVESDAWTAGDTSGGVAAAWRKPALIGGVVLLVIAVIAGVTLFRPKGAGGETLSYEFKTGQSFAYSLRMTMDGTISVPDAGMSRPLKMEIGGVASMEVKSVDAKGVATVDVALTGIFVRSDPAIPTTIPTEMRDTMQVAPNGRVLSGGLGLSQLGSAGQVPPGWDSQLWPWTADYPVNPGDAWSEGADVPFIGDTALHITTDTKMLAYIQENGKRVAVVESTEHIPLDVTISMSELAKEMGEKSDSFELPAGADPKFTYSGEMTMVTTSRIDSGTHIVLGGTSEGTMDVTMTMKGIPGVPEMSADMDLDFSLTLEQYHGRNAEGTGGQSGQPKPQQASKTPGQSGQ